MAKKSRHIISVSVSNTQYRTLKSLARSLHTDTAKLIRSHMFTKQMPRRLTLNHQAIMDIGAKISRFNQLLSTMDSAFQHQHKSIDMSIRKKAQTMDKHLELKPYNMAKAALTDEHSKQLESLYDYESNTIAPNLKTISKELIDVEKLLSHKFTSH